MEGFRRVIWRSPILALMTAYEHVPHDQEDKVYAHTF